VPAILHVTEGPDTGRLFALSGDVITIGRNAENTIVLNDVAVSGVHAKITRNEQGEFTIHDNSSTNGTFLNGKELRASDLRHGDTFSIGSTAFTFEVREHSRRIRPGAQADQGAVRAQGAPGTTLVEVDLAALDRAELVRGYRASLIMQALDAALGDAEGSGELLSAVLDAAMEGAEAARGVILLVDKRSGEMIPSVVKSSDEGLGEVTFSKTLAYDVAHGADGYLGSAPGADSDGGPVMCVPIQTTSHTGGVIYLSGGDFDGGDLELAAAVGRRAGISLSASRWQVDFELLFSSMIDAIMNTIQAKDVYTRGHSERVRHYSKLIGKEIGLSAEELYRVTLGAALHDIGKVGMPDSVLKHNEKPILTPDQMGEVRKHPARGARILEDISFLADVIPAAELHHEDWDGGGYPHGLAGEDIPLIARIVAVADTYDAITTDRPYQKGRSYEEGHAILRKIAGKRLDPELVEAFISAWSKYRKGPKRRKLATTVRVDPAAVPAPQGPATQRLSDAADRAETAETPRAAPEPTPEPDIDDKLSQIIEIG
jgi:HD-GYP domain-containing protein (c-di-GMP phosphodiesterase class II)